MRAESPSWGWIAGLPQPSTSGNAGALDTFKTAAHSSDPIEEGKGKREISLMVEPF